MSKHDIVAQKGPGSQDFGRWNVRSGATPLWFAGLLTVVLLIAGGIGYWAAASCLKKIRENPIALPVPLSGIPMYINGWSGRDVSLSTATDDYIRANFGDDYISRAYTNIAKGLSADVYVVYCSSYPGGLLGHRPDVCFPAHGWIRDLTTTTDITSRAGRKIPCLMHQFHKPSPAFAQASTLSFYVLNGQISVHESDFSGFLDRRPNISGDAARYVAQVQITCGFDRAARLAAADLVDTILTFLPDRSGEVRAASVPGSPAGSSESGDGTRQE